MNGSLQRLAIWLMVLGTWEAAYRLIGWREYIFPAPSHVVDSLFGLLNIHTGFGESFGPTWPLLKDTRLLPDHGLADILVSPLVTAPLVSGARLLVGFVLSIGLGGILGLAMWRWHALDDLLGPLFLGLQTLPSVCWVPLAVLVFGLNENGILFVLVMGSFFAIAISLRDGLRMIPPVYKNAGMMLGARQWKLYYYVLLPASLPALASSLRSGFSFAWRSLMGAELIFYVQRHGLGYVLYQGREFNDVKQVVAAMAVMVAIGMVVDRLVFATLERRVRVRFGLMAG